MPPVLCIVVVCALVAGEPKRCDLETPSTGWHTRTASVAQCSAVFAEAERDPPAGVRPTMWAARRAKKTAEEPL